MHSQPKCYLFKRVVHELVLMLNHDEGSKYVENACFSDMQVRRCELFD